MTTCTKFAAHTLLLFVFNLAVIPCSAAQTPTGGEVLLQRASADAALATPQARRRAISRLDSAITQFRGTGRTVLEASALTMIGAIYLQDGQPDSAVHYYRSVFRLQESPSMTYLHVIALTGLASVYDSLGQRDSVLSIARRALPLLPQISNLSGPSLNARVFRFVATSLAEAGQVDSATYYHAFALEAFRRDANRDGEALTLAEMAELASRRGPLDPALNLTRQSLQITKTLSNRSLDAEVSVFMGTLFRRLGLPDSAMAYFVAGLRTAQAIRDRNLEARALNQIGLTLGDGESVRDSAFALYRRALDLYTATGNRGGEATIFHNLGVSYASIRTDSALYYLRTALLLRQSLGRGSDEASTQVQLGRLFSSLGMVDSARIHLSAAVLLYQALNDRSNEMYAQALALGALAELEDGRGRSDSALILLHQSLQITRILSNRQLEAAVLVRMGIVFRGLTLPDSAMAYFQAGLRTSQAIHDPDLEARALNQIALSVDYGAGRDSAHALYRRALELYRQSGNRKGVARVFHNLGAHYGNSTRIDSALYYLRTALHLRQSLVDRADEARTRVALGEVLWELGLADSAKAHLFSAVAAYQELGDRSGLFDAMTRYAAWLTEAIAAQRLPRTDGPVAVWDSYLGRLIFPRTILQEVLDSSRVVHDREGEARALTWIGKLHSESGFPDSAMSVYRAALRIRQTLQLPDQVASALSNIAAAFADGGRPDSALVYYQQALQIFRELGDEDGVAGMLGIVGALLHRQTRPPDLARAVAYYDSAAAFIAPMRHSAGLSFERELVAHRRFTVYPMWSLALLDRVGEPGIDDREAAEAALGALERGRSQALLDLMHQSAAPRAVGGRLSAEGRAHIEAVRQSGADAALVYMLAEGSREFPGDTLVMWLILRSGTTRVFRRPLGIGQLSVLVDSLRAKLGADESCGSPRPLGRSGYDMALDSLAALLIPPEALAQIPLGGELLIVADGPLNRLPFAALPTNDGEPLGLRFGLRYTPSLAVLAEAEGRPRLWKGRLDDLRGSVVAVNPTMPTVTICNQPYQLQALPEAEPSARTVAARLRAPVLAGPAATEMRIRRLLPAAPVIHFATHSYAYERADQTGESFIALASTAGSDHQADGLLTLAELVEEVPMLRAELITLAACQTGAGSQNAAEGTIGLQRALLARGARTVLVSLWVVNAGPTGKLMEEFYRGWLDEGLSKAEALRRAQATVRRSPGWEHPRYWAGFQLVGAR